MTSHSRCAKDSASCGTKFCLFLMSLKNFVAAYQSLRDLWVSLLKLLLFMLLFKYFVFLI